MLVEKNGLLGFVHSCTLLEPGKALRASLSAIDVHSKYEAPGTGADTRDLVRSFAPELHDSRLLCWDPSLDAEDGAGVRVALFDTGLFWAHPVFRGAQIQARDFTGSGGVFDLTGHGTKSGSLLVAQGYGWLRGLAPACTLLVGKVLRTRDPDTSAGVLARAIRWAVYEGAHIAILPLGRARGSALVAREVCRALEAGCAFFAAAGNRGPDTFLFPARLPGVTAVSAAGPDGRPLSWCSQVSQVDCYAPGHEVLSVGLDGRGAISGSSPATVLAAGVAALRLAGERRLEGKLGAGGLNA